jgi:hypothetical protein
MYPRERMTPRGWYMYPREGMTPREWYMYPRERMTPWGCYMYPREREWYPASYRERMRMTPRGWYSTLGREWHHEDDDENPNRNDIFTINRRWHRYIVHKRDDDILEGDTCAWKTIEMMRIHLGMTPVPSRANDTPKRDDTCTLKREAAGW